MTVIQLSVKTNSAIDEKSLCPLTSDQSERNGRGRSIISESHRGNPMALAWMFMLGKKHSSFLILFIIAVKAHKCFGLLKGIPIWHDHLTQNSICFGRNNIATSFSGPRSHDFANEKSKLEVDGGVVYRQSVCNPRELESMQKEIALVIKRHLVKERSSIAQNRLGATLSRANAYEIINVLENGSICKLVQRLASSSERYVELAREIPVEVRVYEQVGASMAWHQDDILYDPPQLEVVFTLKNTSDCVTMWKKRVGPDRETGEIHSQETSQNSMILLLAGGPDHCVTSLKRGQRTILKCAYVYQGATYIGEEGYCQFGKAESATKNPKRKSVKREKKVKR